MKQQYCDTDLVTFNLQGLLWIVKKEYAFIRNEIYYSIELQYKTQRIDVRFPDKETRDVAYEKTRKLIVPPNTPEE